MSSCSLCSYLSHVGVAANRGLIVLLADLHRWSSTFTHFQEKAEAWKKTKKKQNKKKCNFLSCTEEVFAHSGSKLTTPSTRFRLVHWAHDTPLHGVCSAGNTRRVCKQLGWASVLFLQLFYLCFSPPSAHHAEWRNWMHPLGPVASMDSNEQLVTVNEEQAE